MLGQATEVLHQDRKGPVRAGSGITERGTGTAGRRGGRQRERPRAGAGTGTGTGTGKGRFGTPAAREPAFCGRLLALKLLFKKIKWTLLQVKGKKHSLLINFNILYKKLLSCF